MCAASALPFVNTSCPSQPSATSNGSGGAAPPSVGTIVVVLGGRFNGRRSAETASASLAVELESSSDRFAKKRSASKLDSSSSLHPGRVARVALALVRRVVLVSGRRER